MFDISSWFVPLARRALYLWVRATVFAEGAAAGIDPQRPVCYVLQDRHLSNLLVLFEESRRAALPEAESPLSFGATHSNGSFFFLNHQRNTPVPEVSSLLAGLVRDAVANPDLDMQLVPVVILWGRSPDKQDSILKALLAETWRTPGVVRQFLSVLLHGRQALVRFNAPLSLQALVHGGDAPLGGPGRGRGERRGPPPDGGPRGGRGPGGGPGDPRALFRATHLDPDYSGLAKLKG